MKPSILAITFMLFAALCFAQKPDTSAYAEFNNKFSFENFEHKQLLMPYRKATVNSDKISGRVLVVYLHSSSAKGNDNKAQLYGSEIKDIVKYVETNDISADIIVPQCNKEHSWNESSSEASSAIKALIDSLLQISNYEKVYLFGASTGGAGVWRMISDYPGTFSAAMIVAAYPWNVYPAYLVKTPLCCVIGSKDKRASKSSIMPTIKEMRKRGGDVNLVIYKGYDHYETRKTAFSSDNLKWVFDK